MRLRYLLLSLAICVGCGQVKSSVDAPGGEPGAPTGVTAMANIDKGVRLSWTEPSGAPTGYTITPSPAGGTSMIVGTDAIVTGLTVGTSYTFTVTATNGSGDGPASDPSAAVTIVAGPAAPTELIACGANGQVTVSAGATGAAGFNIYFGGSQGISKLTPTKMTSATLPFIQTQLPNGTAVHYVVTAVDANGVESADTTEDIATPDSVVHDTLFVNSFGTDTFLEAIDCFTKYKTTSTPLARDISGIVSVDYNALALDPTKALLYYRSGTSISVFGDATRVVGNHAPMHTITSASLTNGRGIALDTARDILYVSNAGSKILVFPNASTANGSVVPARTITAVPLTSGSALAIDSTNDRLYVSNQSSVLVFDGASLANGQVSPARSITLNNVTCFGVAVDAAKDILYVGSRNSGQVFSFTASTANGAATPIRTITNGTLQIMALGLANDVLVAIPDSAKQVFVWKNASAQDGQIAPDATVDLPHTMLGAGVAYAP